MVSVAAFVQMLRQSRLLEADQLEELDRLLPTVGDDAHQLGRQLVDRGWLTPYQLEQLRQGHGAALVLGPYHLLEPLGEGGMGQVFKAWQPLLERVVALKVIYRDRMSRDPETVRRFQREARAAAQLSHPNVVLTYDAGKIDDTHYIAMEYVEGIDLSKLVEEAGPLPVERACDFIRQAALGLQHAHERGLVHRDIKPQNLLVTPANAYARPAAGISGYYARPVIPRTGIAPVSAASAPAASPAGQPVRRGPVPLVGELLKGGVVKVLDMGLALVTHAPDGGLTQEGTMMGTPDFVAPEQARNAKVADIRSDLYSLGCTFYYLLTGSAPFPGGTVFEKLIMHYEAVPRPVGELRPETPPAVRAIVRKLMAKRPDERFRTPAELAEALTPGTAAAKAYTLVAVEEEPCTVGASTLIVPGAVAPTLQEKPLAPGGPSGPMPAEVVVELTGHTGGVTALAFSPNRDLLAVGSGDGNVCLWDFTGPQPQERRLPRAHQGEVRALAFSLDSQILATGGGPGDEQVWLWAVARIQQPPKVGPLRHPAPVQALAFSPDGATLASGDGENAVRLWHWAAKRTRPGEVYRGHKGGISAVTFAPDCKSLASASPDGTVRLWHIGRLWGKGQAVLAAEGEVYSAAYAPDGQVLALGGQGPKIGLWDLIGQKPWQRATLAGHRGAVRLLLFTPDSQTLVSVNDGGQVICWDRASSAIRREWAQDEKAACSVALTFDGRYLAAGNRQGTVTVSRLELRSEVPAEFA